MPPRPPGQYEIYPKSYYEYDLVGIVVHSGNAQAGHYYSFIRDRYTSNGDVKERWCKFDDQTVQEWDIESNLEKDTFGGETDSVSMTAMGNYTSTSQESIRNAYLLFYERRFKGSIEARTSDCSNESESKNMESLNEGTNSQEYDKEHLIMAPALRTEVSRDNKRFAFDMRVFETCFFKFASQLYSQLSVSF